MQPTVSYYSIELLHDCQGPLQRPVQHKVGDGTSQPRQTPMMLSSKRAVQERQPGGSSGRLLAPPRNCPPSTPGSDQQHAELETQGAVVFWWQGRQTAVTRDHNGLLLEQLPESSCFPWCSGQPSAAVKYVPYSEILCCRYLPIRRYCSGLPPCQRKQRHYLELQVLDRHPSRPWLWSISKLELAADQPELVKAWVQHTRHTLRALPYRPQRLLVFVNPFGGKRQARRTWSKLAEPILAAAGVDCGLVETQHQGHAEELVRGLSLEQLQQLDGIVAVGGDGLFAELLTAVLQHKHLGAALQLRLGHIPAGSTDAVACTLHGTRDAVTAALHIALGDCTALDVGRMVTLPPAGPHQHQQQQQRPGVAGGAAAGKEQESMPSSVQSGSGVWDAGLSFGSHSELLLGPKGADMCSSQGMTSSTAAAVAAAAAPQNGSAQLGGAPAADHSSSISSVEVTRKHRQQQRRQQKELRKQAKKQRQGSKHHHQQQQQQQQQRGHVSLHVPQLRHFVCVANYGFLGDVMEMSERLRWCGPMRYDIAGALRFLLLRQYKATVWYKPAPLHSSDDPLTPPVGEQQQHKHKQRRKRGGLGSSDTVVSPAAVSPLPHHRAPALHARLPIPRLNLPWQQQQQQQQQQQEEPVTGQQQQEEERCEHVSIASHFLDSTGSSQCSSTSHSRRSSMDLSSGPLSTVQEAHTVGTAAPPAAAAARDTAGGAGTASAAAQLGAPDSSSKQQQGGGKSVSFLPQLTAAVHASAASFSSSRGSGSGGGLWPSRTSSMTSQQSNGTSRCHSRCSRCSAAAMHRSHSRQNFAALSGAATPAVAASPPPPAAGEEAAAAPNSSSSPAGVAVTAAPAAAGGTGAPDCTAHPRSPSSAGYGRGSDAADGIVEVTPIPPPAAAAAAVAAAGSASRAASASFNPAPAGAAAGGAGGEAEAGSGSSTGGPRGPGWVKVEGRYASIMCVVTSCISDKSRQGLMPEAHLADGRLALVMVEGCSRLQYLRFLIQLASKGIVPGSLPFVRVEYATEVQVETEGRQSSWNVDGELLRHGRVNVGIHAGLVDVFARGVELM